MPGLRRPLGDHIEHLVAVEPGLHPEVQALGQGLDQTCDADLIDHLGELARTRLAHQRDGPTVAAHGRSEEHTSELQSLMRISYAVFCLKKTNHTKHMNTENQ